MHIAHINLARGFRGGERQTALLIEELARDNFRQILVCRGDSPLREMLKDVPNLRFHTANQFFLGHLLFGKQKADILHAHEAKGARWAWIENILRGTHYIITRRVPNLISTKTRSVYKNAICVVAISKAIEKILLDYENTLKTRVIPSASTALAPDEKSVKAIRDEFKNRTLVGHIGALSDHHKGQSYIIKAARSLQESRPDLLFLLVGSGKDESMLRELANGLENVRFVGFKPNIADYIAAFDLFVFPSLEEGLGSTLIDVMRLQTPIIASSVDGIPELITHEETGLLIPPKDHTALADAIKRLLSDQGLVAKLITNASKKAEDFSPQNMAKKYKDLYRL